MRRAVMLALLLSVAARAQEEPTPFWMPPPPPAKKAPAKPPRPPAKKRPRPLEPEQAKPPQVKREERRKEKPKGVETRKEPGAPRSMEPSWIEPAPRGPPPRAPKPAPLEVERAPAVRAPAPPLSDAPAARAPAPPLSEAPVPDAPDLVERAPAPARPAPAVPAPAALPEVPAAEQPSTVVLAEPEPEPPADEPRRWSLDAAFGAWGKSRSDGSGRDWQLAYGLRFGRALFPALEVELELLRAGATAGSPFVSASATHNLAALRAFWVLGDRVALLLGGGAGVALAQTHYTLQPSTDGTVPPTGLDANAPRSVIEVTAAFRARLFRGLEARAEVSAAARDGKLEILPLLGAGAAF